MIKHALATDATNLIKPSQLKVLLGTVKNEVSDAFKLLFMAFLSLLLYFFVECRWKIVRTNVTYP